MTIGFSAAPRPFRIAHKTFRYYASAPGLDPPLCVLRFLQLSIDRQSLKLTEQSHGRVFRLGFDQNAVVATKLISAYSACRDPVEARVVFDSVRCKNVYIWNAMINGCSEFIESRKLFDEMPRRNISSWNTLLGGFMNSEEEKVDSSIIWEFVKTMQIEGLKPDAYTVSSLLPLCGGDAGKWNRGREVHCYTVKNGLELGSGSDVHLGCCLIDMYSRSNKVNVAGLVFDHMKSRNVFAWTALINGYVQNGESEKALILFREMQMRDGTEPNRVSLVCLLPACISLASLMGGKQIHGFAIRKELTHEVSLCNALIDMYAKCGSLTSARRLFEDHPFCKDAVSWSSMISGYGLHGKGQEAIYLYEKMLQLGIKPDVIVMVGVLSACSRSGLVNEGLDIYNSVVRHHGIKPTLEMCACVVDMLGRSGQLKQALDFIKAMAVEPGPSVWGALLSASLLHGNSEIRDLAYEFLIRIEPENASNYVSLSNSYASSQKWGVAAEVRTVMKEKQLRKLPGCSWITVNKETHSFYVADKAHPCSDIIYGMLDELVLMMKGYGNSRE
ncbi:putative pentatricopeptide repeat-containing protein At1g68930 isoform X2 [Diospyros lotus]|uniref:putative pentatricopeptide repeat-containing protein At1g68930 isoform X2 n=1 Tax=Diospyros lotus TaxID=55363 RepID=UPI002252C08E|nr:putative pentatricopeptide repeat-containing protein At1g68930 isoform X2 [Diospyros lotus]